MSTQLLGATEESDIKVSGLRRAWLAQPPIFFPPIRVRGTMGLGFPPRICVRGTMVLGFLTAHLRPWDDGFEVFSHRFASVVRDSGHNTLSIRHSTPNALHCEALNPHRFNRLAKTIAYQYILARVTRRRFRLTLGTGGTGGIEASLAPSTTASLFHLGLHRRTSTTLQNSKKISSCCCWQTGWCKKPETPPP